MPNYREFILFDYCTGVRERVTIEQVAGYTGLSKRQLWMLKYKQRPIYSIHSYLLDNTAKLRDFKRLMSNHPQLDGELWKSYRQYSISSSGRIKDSKGNFMLPALNGGTVKIVFSNRDAKILHRLVYKLFIGPLGDNEAIVHINGNNRDCEASNLKKIPLGMQCKHYGKKTQPIVRIDDMGEVEYFGSIGECAKKSYVGVNTVSKGLRDGLEHCGFYFYYESEYKGDKYA